MGFLTLDADEIVPGLWQGSIPETGGVVRAAGFDYLVLCAREYQPSAASYPDVQVIYAPNDDHDAYPFTKEKLRIALQAARSVNLAVRAGQHVLVTCAAGLNRSGLVSALALHLLYGWAGVACITKVRKQRPQSRVHKGRGALNNGDFVRALSRIGQAAR